MSGTCSRVDTSGSKLNIDNKTPFEVDAIPFKGPDRKHFLTIIAKGTFSIAHRKMPLVAEDQIPIAYGDEPWDTENGGSIKFEADTAPFKPRADVVLVGHAYPPKGMLAVTGVDVSLRVGLLHKVLRIFGNRTWHYGTLIPDHYTRPEPFTKMPIVYERSFGGIDKVGGGYCVFNPCGCGFLVKTTRKSVNTTVLPNIENPAHCIRSPEDKPFPEGFGFFGRTWEPRCHFMGTYDEKWRKEKSPDLPDDFSYDYYNGAHPDLQIEGYLAGDESVELLNLTSEGKLQFNLPALQLDCTVERSNDLPVENQGEKGHEKTPQAFKDGMATVPMLLDTFCLIPDEKRFYLVWRGRTEILDLTAKEITSVSIS